MDEFELHARKWTAQERIRRHAQSITEKLDLDPAPVERMEQADREDDNDAFFAAAAEFLELVASEAGRAR